MTAQHVLRYILSVGPLHLRDAALAEMLDRELVSSYLSSGKRVLFWPTSWGFKYLGMRYYRVSAASLEARFRQRQVIEHVISMLHPEAPNWDRERKLLQVGTAAWSVRVWPRKPLTSTLRRNAAVAAQQGYGLLAAWPGAPKVQDWPIWTIPTEDLPSYPGLTLELIAAQGVSQPR